jgi:hypothetical protein
MMLLICIYVLVKMFFKLNSAPLLTLSSKRKNVPETHCEHSQAFNVMILGGDCNWLLVSDFRSLKD